MYHRNHKVIVNLGSQLSWKQNCTDAEYGGQLVKYISVRMSTLVLGVSSLHDRIHTFFQEKYENEDVGSITTTEDCFKG